MKAVAALRNQFGGHAVRRRRRPDAPRRSRRRAGRPGAADASLTRVHVEHLSLDRLPLLRRGGGRPRPRGHDAGRRQRPGQDQRRRGARLPGHAGQPPGRDRRAAGALRRRAGRGPGAVAPRRPGRPGRAGDHPRQGQPGPGQPLPVPRPREVLGLLRTVVFAPEDLAVVKGDPDERRRFLDDLLVAAQPRATPGSARTTTGCSGSATPCCKNGRGAARRGPRRAASPTLEVWDSHLAQTGAGAAGGPAAHPRRSWPARASRPTPTSSGVPGALRTAYRARGLHPGSARGAPGACRRRRPTAAELRDALLAALGAGARAPSSTAAPRWSARTATTSTLDLDGLPARGYASHGESWSTALALRLGSLRPAARTTGGEDGEPVLVLDDVFAELDARRRDATWPAGRRRRAGAGHRRGRRGRPGRAGRRCSGPASGDRRGRAVSGLTASGARHAPATAVARVEAPGPARTGPCGPTARSRPGRRSAGARPALARAPGRCRGRRGPASRHARRAPRGRGARRPAAPRGRRSPCPAPARRPRPAPARPDVERLLAERRLDRRRRRRRGDGPLAGGRRPRASPRTASRWLRRRRPHRAGRPPPGPPSCGCSSPTCRRRLDEGSARAWSRSIEVLGPDAPSWKRGPRSVPAAGARATPTAEPARRRPRTVLRPSATREPGCADARGARGRAGSAETRRRHGGRGLGRPGAVGGSPTHGRQGRASEGGSGPAASGGPAGATVDPQRGCPPRRRSLAA